MATSIEVDLRSIQASLRKRDYIPSTEILAACADIFGTKNHGYQRIDDATTLHVMDLEPRQPYTLSMARRDLVCVQILIAGTYDRNAGDISDTVSPAMLHITNCPQSTAYSATGSRLRGLFIAFERQHLLNLYGPEVALLPEPYRPIFLSADGMPRALKMPLKASTIVAVEQILSCKYAEPLKAMFLSAKVTEIMCGVISQLNGLAFRKMSRDAPAGLQVSAIEAAARIYRREIQKPPTIEQLAFRVGVNRNELTLGFREVFGTTPHAYFHDVRMKRAHELLLKPELAISEIARQVGYEGYASFSRAYSDYFGCSPTVGRQRPSGSDG